MSGVSDRVAALERTVLELRVATAARLEWLEKEQQDTARQISQLEAREGMTAGEIAREAGMPGPGGMSRCQDPCCTGPAGHYGMDERRAGEPGEPGGWMILWRLTPTGRIEAGEVAGMVVAAGSAREARDLAAGEAGDEGRAVWLSGLSSCMRLGEADRGIAAQVLIRDVAR